MWEPSVLGCLFAFFSNPIHCFLRFRGSWLWGKGHTEDYIMTRMYSAAQSRDDGVETEHTDFRGQRGGLAIVTEQHSYTTTNESVPFTQRYRKLMGTNNSNKSTRTSWCILLHTRYYLPSRFLWLLQSPDFGLLPNCQEVSCISRGRCCLQHIGQPVFEVFEELEVHTYESSDRLNRLQ